MLSDVLQRFPGIGSAVYQHLDYGSRWAMRLVCKQLRAAIDDAASSLFIGLNDSDDPDEVLQRLARTSLRPSELHLDTYSRNSTQLTLLLAALLAQELVPVLHGVQHLTLLSAWPLSAALLQTLTLSELQVDSAASLRACASGILQHCNDIYKLFTYNHGQEFKAAAAGAGCCWRHWHHGSRGQAKL
ncbi:hypothetical protein V8C86DRAFT_3027299 [Haematococcus lacustris]